MNKLDDKYYYTVNGKRFGPFTYSVVKGLVTSEVLGRSVNVWRSGQLKWLPMEETEFGRFLPPPPIPPPAPEIQNLRPSIPPLSPVSNPVAGAEVSTNIESSEAASPIEALDESKKGAFQRANTAFWAIAGTGGMVLTTSISSQDIGLVAKALVAVIGGLAIGVILYPVALIWCILFKKKK